MTRKVGGSGVGKLSSLQEDLEYYNDEAPEYFCEECEVSEYSVKDMYDCENCKCYFCPECMHDKKYCKYCFENELE